jgi:hypothetical protein
LSSLTAHDRSSSPPLADNTAVVHDGAPLCFGRVLRVALWFSSSFQAQALLLCHCLIPNEDATIATDSSSAPLHKHTDSHTHAHSTSCAGPPGSTPRMLPPVGPPCSLLPSSDRARQWSTGYTRRTAASLLSPPAPTSSWSHATVQCSTQKSVAGRQDQLRWEKVVETVNRVRSWKVCMQLDCKHGNDATHHPLVGADSHCHQLLHQRWDHGKGLRKASPATTEKHKALDM